MGARFFDKFVRGRARAVPSTTLAHEERREMIRGVSELSETTVKEIMVPRTDMRSVCLDDSNERLLADVRECSFSRLPAYRGTIDNIVGVLYLKDLLRALLQGTAERELDIVSIVRKPYFVPEGKKIDALLREFRKRKVHMAVVVDEYGGTSGIVCLEDVIEQIVGDIQDEFDDEPEDIVEIGKGVYLCDARLGIGELNDALHLDLPTEDYETLGGFVLHLLDRIPVRDDTVSFGGREFTVQQIEGRKIDKVKIVETAARESRP
jgi:CBS domain containing-hemolysin-like protein